MTGWNFPPHNGKQILQQAFPDWRVVERDGMVTLYKDITWNHEIVMIRLGMEGAVLFQGNQKWLAMQDFKRVDQYQEWLAGEVRLDNVVYWKPWFIERLHEGKEELTKVAERVGAYYNTLLYKVYAKPNIQKE